MTEQTRQTQITLNLPAMIGIGGPAGHDKAMPTGAWSAEFVLDMALHGIKQRRTDKFSVVKSGKGETEALEALAELDARLAAGEIPAGGGGGGARLDPVEKGWIEFFKARTSPVKIKNVTPNGKTLERFMDLYAKQVLAGARRKTLEGMDEATQREWMATEWPKKVAAALPKIRERDEADMTEHQPGWFIQIERDKAAGVTRKEETIKPMDFE